MFHLAGKTVLVTGASSGLGAHFARVVAGAGAAVVLAARRTHRLELLADELRAGGTEVLTTSMDVTEIESIKSAFASAEERFGVCDVLVNNAGVADSQAALRTSEESWDFVTDTNLKGAFFVAKEAAARMVRNKCDTGSIINICSILGERPAVGSTSYGASKSGLIHVTKTMAMELARHNIRVNALCPGYFETEMNKDYFATARGQQYIATTPSKRVGRLPELSGPLLLLASPASSFMSGSIITVDGAHLCSSL